MIDIRDLLQRIARAAIFTGLCALGLGLMFGFASPLVFLSLAVTVMCLFAIQTGLATTLAIFAFCIGLVLSFAGYKPLTPASIAEKGAQAVETAGAVAQDVRAKLLRSQEATNAPLARRMEELKSACDAKLLSPDECASTRARIIESFAKGTSAR